MIIESNELTLKMKQSSFKKVWHGSGQIKPLTCSSFPDQTAKTQLYRSSITNRYVDHVKQKCAFGECADNEGTDQTAQIQSSLSATRIINTTEYISREH